MRFADASALSTSSTVGIGSQVSVYGMSLMAGSPSRAPRYFPVAVTRASKNHATTRRTNCIWNRSCSLFTSPTQASRRSMFADEKLLSRDVPEATWYGMFRQRAVLVRLTRVYASWLVVGCSGLRFWMSQPSGRIVAPLSGNWTFRKSPGDDAASTLAEFVRMAVACSAAFSAARSVAISHRRCLMKSSSAGAIRGIPRS